MILRSVRGATTVSIDSEDEIIQETSRMLRKISQENAIDNEDIVSVFFTVTKDLNAVFPAKAAREIGWTQIPLLDAIAPNIENSLKKCIRVMIHFYTYKNRNEIKHIYLNGATVLRPDLVE